MKVQVELYATLTKFLPPGAEGRKAMVELPEGATVGDLLKRLGIPDGMAALHLVNGTHQPPETVLKDGETLAMFPPLAGGAPPGLSIDDFRFTI
jgi:molybdopterin converting factor small subunit